MSLNEQRARKEALNLHREKYIDDITSESLDLIALDCGVIVQYSPLKAAAASIVHQGDRAVITINSSIQNL